jgi:hypothetical protein
VLESFRPSRPERFSRGTTSLSLARLPGVSLRGAARCARARAWRGVPAPVSVSTPPSWPRPCSCCRLRWRSRGRPPRARRPRAPTSAARPSSRASRRTAT